MNVVVPEVLARLYGLVSIDELFEFGVVLQVADQCVESFFFLLLAQLVQLLLSCLGVFDLNLLLDLGILSNKRRALLRVLAPGSLLAGIIKRLTGLDLFFERYATLTGNKIWK